MTYRGLSADRIFETVQVLGRRIGERFPGSGLSSTCSELQRIASQAQERATSIARPIGWLRVLTAALIALIVVSTIVVLVELRLPDKDLNLVEFIQIAEAGINDLVLIGASIFFLGSLETRMKRRRALEAIHELRALVHVIDMHQLLKDPERTTVEQRPTESSPESSMGVFEMRRYLDYCSEMLALSGKLAALYVQRFDDPVVLGSVNEVESLAGGLSNKIWQKMMILHQPRN